MAAEILPLADALRFLEREAPSLLSPRPLGRRGLPRWLAGCETEIRRVPFGVVLVVGPANYPLFLPGVQAVQALVAGNVVWWKPGNGGGGPAARLARAFRDAGLPPGVLTVLDEGHDPVVRAIEAGVDKVVLTGSAEAGRKILPRLVDPPVPSVMELSGSDSVLVRSDADVERVGEALAFGLRFNASRTCIAPRRLFVHRDVASALERRLIDKMRDLPSVAIDPATEHRVRALLSSVRDGGGTRRVGKDPADGSAGPMLLSAPFDLLPRLDLDLPLPVLAMTVVESDERALEGIARAPQRLGAAVFGDPDAAAALAERIDVGVVLINDLIVPTADPRVPFGGSGASGFGVTRGGEGLLEMTRVKTLIRRAGRLRPHYSPAGECEAAILEGYLGWVHGDGWRRRWRSLVRMVRAASRRGRPSRENGT